MPVCETTHDVRKNTNTAQRRLFCDPSNIDERSWLDTPFGREKTSRALMIIPTVVVHLSIGSMYSWSLFNSALITSLGVVAPAAGDWSFATVVPIFSTIVGIHGISAWLLSNWQVRAGARRSLLAGALCFGGGMILAGVGAHYHFLPLLYIGYGVLGGLGLGLSYVPPMANLIRWFPERVGFATGITSCGFGGAALLAAPAIQRLLHCAYRAPTFIGDETTTTTTTLADGRLMADIAGVFYEVVRSSPGSALAPNAVDLVQGFYQVGTGSTGADVALAAMGALYLVAMSAAAFLIKKPPPHYASAAILKATALPSNSTAAKPLSSAPADVSGVADIRAVMRCRQFYLLWVTFAALATVGMSIAGTAKDLIREVFGGLLPSLVTPSFAVGYVAAFSLFNLGGRLGWSSLSDRFGKKNTFRVFGFAGLPLALILPLSIAAAVYFARDEDAAEGEELINVSSADKNSKAPVMVVVALGAFLSSSLLVASIFGGTYATVPAFATELFGRAAIDRVHGRLLTASAFAGLCGPVLVSQLRARAERQAIEALVATVDERRFAERFGVPRDQAASLAKARTLTIAKLLEIAPEGTEDPTPWLYTSTLYALSSLFVVAAVTNQMIVKVPGSVFKSGK